MQVGRKRQLKSTLAELVLTTQQAQRLSVGAYRQLSPHLENCCLRINANVSYAQAEGDVDYLTGLCTGQNLEEHVGKGFHGIAKDQ